MDAKEALEKIRKSMDNSMYGESSFRWKTPNTFVLDNEIYSLSDKEALELREEVGKFIKIYLDAKKENT